MNEPEQQKYVILDGVRRTKAASELGRKTVRARINVNDILGPAIDIPIEDMNSTKDVIQTSGSGYSRWRKILNSMESGVFPDGEPVPPVEVKRGSYGIPIKDVIIEGQGELEKFFQ